MNLSANDVRAATFQRRMRGLDPDEVASFMDSLAQRIEELEQEAHSARLRVQELELELSQYRDRDQSLRDALIEVRQRSEESRETARREAELIVKEAELKAERLLAGGEDQARTLRRELRQLGERRERHVSRMRHLLQSQLELLDALDEEQETGEGE